MKWSEDDEYDRPSGSSTNMVTLVLGILIFTLVLFGLLLYGNRYELGLVKRPAQDQIRKEQAGVDTAKTDTGLEDYISDDPITADDLGFWNMYPETETLSENDAMPAETESTEPETETEPDPSEGGKKTKVTLRDGTEEWVTISNYIAKNTIDVTGLKMTGQVMEYYREDRKNSFFGVDLSRSNGGVNFRTLKKNGVDFVMLKVGGRGYESGTVTLDEYFYQNLVNARDAGLQVGLYFYSQAVSIEEAGEEVAAIVDAVGDQEITYPIAIDMEYVQEDTSRVEKLTKEQRTSVTKAFCDMVRAAGYTPMIYGNKEWLIKEINLAKLADVDIWLSQMEEIPDYPYRISLWQYKRDGVLDGVSGTVNLNISFIDYTMK